MRAPAPPIALLCLFSIFFFSVGIVIGFKVDSGRAPDRRFSNLQFQLDRERARVDLLATNLADCMEGQASLLENMAQAQHRLDWIQPRLVMTTTNLVELMRSEAKQIERRHQREHAIDQSLKWRQQGLLEVMTNVGMLNQVDAAKLQVKGLEAPPP